MSKACINTQYTRGWTVPHTRHPGSLHVDVWPNGTTLLSRICLETGPVRSYSAQDQPSGLQHFTAMAVVGKNANARLITGQCEPPSGRQASHQVLLIFQSVKLWESGLMTVTLVLTSWPRARAMQLFITSEECVVNRPAPLYASGNVWRILHACTVKGTIWHGEVYETRLKSLQPGQQLCEAVL